MLSSITKLPFFVLILCLGQMATAQTNCSGQITGRILNGKTEQPIPIASIRVLNSTIGAVSDENGKFILKNICESEVDFEVRFIAFTRHIFDRVQEHRAPGNKPQLLQCTFLEHESSISRLETGLISQLPGHRLQ